MFTNGSMTILNRINDPTTKEVYYISKVIENVFWDSVESVSERNGADKSDEVVVYLPTDKNDMTNYVEPKQFNGEIATWTIKEGDFIIRDIIQSGQRINGIKDLKDYETFTIYFVDNNDFGSSNMQHFKIKGK